MHCPHPYNLCKCSHININHGFCVEDVHVDEEAAETADTDIDGGYSITSRGGSGLPRPAGSYVSTQQFLYSFPPVTGVTVMCRVLPPARDADIKGVTKKSNPFFWDPVEVQLLLNLYEEYRPQHEKELETFETIKEVLDRCHNDILFHFITRFYYRLLFTMNSLDANGERIYSEKLGKIKATALKKKHERVVADRRSSSSAVGTRGDSGAAVSGRVEEQLGVIQHQLDDMTEVGNAFLRGLVLPKEDPEVLLRDLVLLRNDIVSVATELTHAASIGEETASAIHVGVELLFISVYCFIGLRFLLQELVEVYSAQQQTEEMVAEIARLKRVETVSS